MFSFRRFVFLTCALRSKNCLKLIFVNWRLVTTSLFSISVSVFLFCYIHQFVLIFRFHVSVISYSICPSLFDFSVSIMPSKSIHVIANGRTSSFLWLGCLFIIFLRLPLVGSNCVLSLNEWMPKRPWNTCRMTSAIPLIGTLTEGIYLFHCLKYLALLICLSVPGYRSKLQSFPPSPCPSSSVGQHLWGGSGRRVGTGEGWYPIGQTPLQPGVRHFMTSRFYVPGSFAVLILGLGAVSALLWQFTWEPGPRGTSAGLLVPQVPGQPPTASALLKTVCNARFPS